MKIKKIGPNAIGGSTIRITPNNIELGADKPFETLLAIAHRRFGSLGKHQGEIKGYLSAETVVIETQQQKKD